MFIPSPTIRGRFKPPGSPRINFAHPLAAGLVQAIVYFGGVPYDLLGGFSLPNGARPKTFASKGGGGWSYDGSSQLSYGGLCPINGLSKFTLAAFITPGTLAANGFIYAFTQPGQANPIYSLGTNASTASAARIFARNIGGGGSGTAIDLSTAGGVLSTNVPAVISASFDIGGIGNTNKIYVNGTNSASGTTINVLTCDGTLTNIGGLHRTADGNFSAFTGHVFLAWNRYLSDAEHLQIGVDPTCMLIFPQDDLFALLVGANAPAGGNLFRNSNLDGLGASGPFFGNPLAA